MILTKENRIEETFGEIDSNFDFITLRNFHHIPKESSIENDIDLIIKKDQYHKFADMMRGLGFEVKFDVGHEYLYGAKEHIHCVDRKLGVHFDVVNGLYYRSLNQRNLFVGGFEYLENSLWEGKKSVEKCFRYVPSDEDFLTHICCHCIFDKMEVTPTYKKLIEKFYSKSDKKNIGVLFGHAFYKAADRLMDIIEEGNTTNIVKEYTEFSDY